MVDPVRANQEQMDNRIVVQYLGFEVKDSSREYAFSVRVMTNDLCRYTLAIANDAFLAHRVRYQDGPEICSLRLHRELDANANQPPTSHFSVTDAELAAYKDGQSPKAARGFLHGAVKQAERVKE